jgi:alpha-glucosidase
MVWEAGADNAGFSSGKPWLPVPASHRAQAVDIQNFDDNSVLAGYRTILSLRKAHPALVEGSIRFLDTEGEILAFVRQGEGETLLCVFNFADEPADWPLPQDFGPVVAIVSGDGAVLQEEGLSLPALGSFVGRAG